MEGPSGQCGEHDLLVPERVRLSPDDRQRARGAVLPGQGALAADCPPSERKVASESGARLEIGGMTSAVRCGPPARTVSAGRRRSVPTAARTVAATADRRPSARNRRQTEWRRRRRPGRGCRSPGCGPCHHVVEGGGCAERGTGTQQQMTAFGRGLRTVFACLHCLRQSRTRGWFCSRVSGSGTGSVIDHL